MFTPYYSEIVLYSMPELLKKNEDGISILFYLQKIFPGIKAITSFIPSTMEFGSIEIENLGIISLADEWKNFLARIGRDENALETELFDSENEILELRFWASYRGQTLARTGEFHIWKTLTVLLIAIELPRFSLLIYYLQFSLMIIVS